MGGKENRDAVFNIIAFSFLNKPAADRAYAGKQRRDLLKWSGSC
jgi:hypothetical protein